MNRPTISAKPVTESDWRWLDRQTINPADGEQLALLCDLFHTGLGRILIAVDEVGTNLGDLRRYLQENPG